MKFKHKIYLGPLGLHMGSRNWVNKHVVRFQLKTRIKRDFDIILNNQF